MDKFTPQEGYLRVSFAIPMRGWTSIEQENMLIDLGQTEIELLHLTDQKATEVAQVIADALPLESVTSEIWAGSDILAHISGEVQVISAIWDMGNAAPQPV